MKLIDKDRLLKAINHRCEFCKSQSDYYPSKCKICDFDLVPDYIDNSKEIDAIPIEWIRNWGFAKYEETKECVRTECHGCQMWNLEMMIEDWREHEADKR